MYSSRRYRLRREKATDRRNLLPQCRNHLSKLRVILGCHSGFCLTNAFLDVIYKVTNAIRQLGNKAAEKAAG